MSGSITSEVGNKNTKAIISLTLGILSILFSMFYMFSILFGIVSLILGVIALKETKYSNQPGRGLAEAGVVCSIVGIIFSLAMIVIISLFLSPVDFRLVLN